MIEAGNGQRVGERFALGPELEFARLVARVRANLKRGHHDHLGADEGLGFGGQGRGSDSGGDDYRHPL